ncbi:hypothetical protein ACFQVA_03645 [Actinomadura keratinilytica]
MDLLVLLGVGLLTGTTTVLFGFGGGSSPCRSWCGPTPRWAGTRRGWRWPPRWW